jgi:hypothetical protein
MAARLIITVTPQEKELRTAFFKSWVLTADEMEKEVMQVQTPTPGAVSSALWPEIFPSVAHPPRHVACSSIFVHDN